MNRGGIAPAPYEFRSLLVSFLYVAFPAEEHNGSHTDRADGYEHQPKEDRFVITGFGYIKLGFGYIRLFRRGIDRQGKYGFSVIVLSLREDFDLDQCRSLICLRIRCAYR